MKFQQKYKVIRENYPVNESLRKELGEYEFNVAIEFSDSPCLVFDVDHNVVLKQGDQNVDTLGELSPALFVMEDGLTALGKTSKFMQCGTVKFKRFFNLNDFFIKNKDADCIIFYVDSEHPYTVYHAGNIIRCAIIKNKELLEEPEGEKAA